MNVLSLFSGIGGLELGLERAGMTTVGQVEIDPYCQRVLAKHWPDVPRHDDVRTAAEWWQSQERPDVDVICGGFPCPPFSDAGERRGLADERWGWPWFADVIRAIRPRYVLLENVAAIVRFSDAIGTIAADLAACGFDLEWDCIPAAAVGAPHRRDRWFGIAYPDTDGRRQPQLAERDSEPLSRLEASQRYDALGLRADVADTDGEGSPRRAGAPSGRPSEARRLEPQRLGSGRTWDRPTTSGHWASEPDVGRVAHGIPRRVDRLRALGNSVVPQVAEYVGQLIMNHQAAA